MLTLAITGSSGFIGTNFIKNVKDFQIIGIDLIDQKVSDINFAGVDSVLHLAALVHQMKGASEEQYFKVNKELALEVAQKAKQHGVKLFIQMSTIAVYGNASQININSPYQPQNAYGKSKLMADENILKMQTDSFKVAIVRPPLVYGGGKAPGNMMRLIKLADKRIPLPFKGSDNKRDFIHINNLVQYLSIIAEKQLNGIHLISDQEPVSTEYLLNTISQCLEKKATLIKVPSFILQLIKAIRPNEYNKLFGTLNIETNFLFEDKIQRYSVKDGITEMVQWYKSNKTKY